MFKSTLALTVLGTALVAAAAPAHAGDGTDLLKFAPETSQMVLVFDVADARDSSLLQKGMTKLLDASAEAKTKLAELGLDPMKDIDTIMFAGGGAKDLSDGGPKEMVIVVEGRLPKDKLSTLPNAIKTSYSGIDIYSHNDTDAAFIGDRMFFVKKGKMKAEIDIALGKGKGKGKNLAASKKGKALRAAIAATDTTADLWATILVPTKNQADMKKEGMVAKTVAAGINFTSDLGIAFDIGTDADASAAKVVGLVQAQLPQITQGLGTVGLSKAGKSFTVKQVGPSVKMAVTLTEAELMALMNLAKQFGAMGGGNP
ncbi:MAG: hypothetical protein IPL61_22160 [Myxococcales bacterium]|nr:hypothetical protein [Myxococcales bacterium]